MIKVIKDNIIFDGYVVAKIVKDRTVPTTAMAKFIEYIAKQQETKTYAKGYNDGFDDAVNDKKRTH